MNSKNQKIIKYKLCEKMGYEYQYLKGRIDQLMKIYLKSEKQKQLELKNTKSDHGDKINGNN